MLKYWITASIIIVICILIINLNNILNKIGDKIVSNDIIVKNKKTGAIIEYKRDYTKICEDTGNDLICFYITTDDIKQTKRVFKKDVGYKKETIEII
jgi:hypothetical protein